MNLPLLRNESSLPRRRWLAIGFGVLAVLGLSYLAFGPSNAQRDAVANQAEPDNSKKLLFCSWNVENMFDDKDDKRKQVDELYDTAFFKNEQLRKLKYERISSALMKMNGGNGPDVISCIEVESVRALELLMAALNEKVKDPAMKYKSMAMKNLDAGRHIAPGVISRYPLSQYTTKLHGQDLRILETHLIVNGYDLCIVASHWTSKLKQSSGGNGEAGREKYARTIYDLYRGMTKKKSDVDFLVSGDFNDTPDSDIVTDVLGGIGDIKKVKASGDYPPLLDLFAGKTGDKFGTLWFDGKPLIYDHICVSGGMLDELGWSCKPESVATVTDGLIRPGSTRRQPWRFGDPDQNMKDGERGFADHFPVTVELMVRASKAPAPNKP